MRRERIVITWDREERDVGPHLMRMLKELMEMLRPYVKLALTYGEDPQ